MKPLKRFGQNFLTDKNIILKIIDEINVQDNDILLEIGPGRGALTEFLFDKGKKYIAYEIDERVIEDLKLRFNNLNVINEDFLDADLTKIAADGEKIKVAGNIPYYITSPIIFKLVDNNKFVSDATLMVQHEVAKRIIADKNTKDYGILTVLLNYFCDVKYAFKVSPHVFYPVPEVSSAIIHLYFKDLEDSQDFQNLFREVVRASFANRRKMLKNSLLNSKFSSIVGQLDFDLKKRAEDIDIQGFRNLTAQIQKLFSRN